jgi:hypothetical protein
MDLTKAERNQPFIIIIGEPDAMKEVTLIVDKVFAKLKEDVTVVRAILLLFAGYFILNLEYPVAAKTAYLYLEYHLFGTCSEPSNKEYHALFK